MQQSTLDAALFCQICREPAEPAMRLAGAGFDCESRHILCGRCAATHQKHNQPGSVNGLRCPTCRRSGTRYIPNPQVDDRLGALLVHCHCCVPLANAEAHVRLHVQAREAEQSQADLAAQAAELESVKRQLATMRQEAESLCKALHQCSKASKRLLEDTAEAPSSSRRARMS